MSYPSVVGDARLSAQHRAAADGYGASQSHLPGEDRVGADDAVVTHLHQVVEFGALADTGLPKPRAVDAGVCSDLYVIFEDDTSNLRNLFESGGPWDIPKSVRAQDRPRMNPASAADLGVRVEGDMGEDDRFIANLDVMANISKRANHDVFSQARRWLDDSSGVNTDGMGLREVRSQHERERTQGVFDLDARRVQILTICHRL